MPPFIYIRLIIDCALSCCLLGKITIVLFLPMEIQILLEVYIINRQICNLGYALQFRRLGSAIQINKCILLFKKDALNCQHIFQTISCKIMQILSSKPLFRIDNYKYFLSSKSVYYNDF